MESGNVSVTGMAETLKRHEFVFNDNWLHIRRPTDYDGPASTVVADRGTPTPRNKRRRSKRAGYKNRAEIPDESV